MSENKRPKLYEYAILYHPTKEEKKNGAESKLISGPDQILAMDEREAQMKAVWNVPSEYQSKVSQVEIALRPF